MTFQFRKNLLDEMHIVTFQNKPEAVCTDEQIVKAMTMNENLKQMYGFTFKPADLFRIGAADASEEVFSSISDMIPEIKAKPMYPDFPSQVMAMDEAQYRMHQLMHYFSTYGLEDLFGVSVAKGWLPETEETEKTKEDIHLLDNTVLEAVSEDEVYSFAYSRILSKRERMTIPETEIVKECLLHLAPEEMTSVNIRFKENLVPVFSVCMNTLNGEVRINAIHALCQHTGDVFKCTREYLNQNKWHLKTSQKRAIVKILESYPVSDFENNLIPSREKREEILLVLQYTDYNMYAKSLPHKELVRQLREGSLRSWQAHFTKALLSSPKEAVAIASQRPGEMLRKAAWMFRNGVSKKDLRKALEDHADQLSTQTLVTVCRKFSDYESFSETDSPKEKAALFDIFMHALGKNLASKDTVLKDKKVYIEEGGFAFSDSVMETNDKSQEGGYVRSGLAYRIPEEVHTVRFFTYWNDERRIDIDLHAFGEDKENQPLHIGWNRDYKDQENGLAMSGDITHSNAAEFIDIDLTKATGKVKYINLMIHSYTGVPFSQIETVLTGMMAVSKTGVKTDVKLYTPANCFYHHELKENAVRMMYGFIDIDKRILVFNGKTPVNGSVNNKMTIPLFTLNTYLHMLLEAQNASVVKNKEEAEYVIQLGKAENDKEISLLDANYFMDA